MRHCSEEARTEVVAALISVETVAAVAGAGQLYQLGLQRVARGGRVDVGAAVLLEGRDKGARNESMAVQDVDGHQVHDVLERGCVAGEDRIADGNSASHQLRLQARVGALQHRVRELRDIVAAV